MSKRLLDPDPHSLKDIAYHAKTACLYDRVVSEPRQYANDLLFHELDSLVPRRGGMLDLGCGTGHMLLRYGASFGHCVGVDHSAAMLEVARERLEGGGTPMPSLSSRTCSSTLKEINKSNTTW